jgi:hypothetical protein
MSPTARDTFIKKSVIWETAVDEAKVLRGIYCKATADANVILFNLVYLTKLSVNQATSVPYNIRMIEKRELKWKLWPVFGHYP